MINMRSSKKFCCESLSKIQNYTRAIKDTTQTWDCHHRAEILPCGTYSRDQLKATGIYYNRPASELIFLTRSQHISLHNTVRSPMKGKHHSISAKRKMSDSAIKHPVCQYTLDGVLVETFESIKDAALKTGSCKQHISECCRNVRTKHNGFKWQYKEIQ